MERTDLAPTAGIVACLAFVFALTVPYAVISTPGAASSYYAVGPISPLFAGLFALVAVIVFAAAREGRSDPALSAGVALVFGAFVAAFCLLWLASGPGEVVLSLDEPGVEWLQYHPVAVALVSLAVPVCGAWYARVLGLL